MSDIGQAQEDAENLDRRKTVALEGLNQKARNIDTSLMIIAILLMLLLATR